MIQVTRGNAVVLTELIVTPKRNGRAVCPLYIIEIEYALGIWTVADLALN